MASMGWKGLAFVPSCIFLYFPFNKFKKFGILEARDRIRKFREEQLRRSDEVLEIWRNSLCDCRHKLGNEGDCHVDELIEYIFIFNVSLNFRVDHTRTSMHCSL